MRYSLLLSGLLVILLYSCQESVINGFPPEKDFPNTTGTIWKYEVVDSLNNIRDTLEITVGGMRTLTNGNQVTIWELNYGDSTDSNYVFIEQDTIKIFQDPEYLIDNIKFVFPLRTGAGWKGDYISDTFYVSGVSQISVPAGNFNNAFIIQREYGGFNEYKLMTIWFVPNVGIVKLHQRDVGFSFLNETRELMSYNIR